MALSARRSRGSPDIWPGFVDAISALLIIVIFLLMVFTLAQYFLSEQLSGRDEALERLNRQIAEISDMLSLERGANADLRGELSQLSAQLQASISIRDDLSNQLAELMPDRDALSAMVDSLSRERETFSAELAKRTSERDALAAQAETAAARAQAELEAETQRAEKVSAELEDAYKTVAADKQKIELQLRRIASMERDIAALRQVREKLEDEVATLAGAMKARDSDLAEIRKQSEQLRDRSKELEAKLSSEQERTVLSQKTIDEKDVRLKKLMGRAQIVAEELTEEQKARNALKRLNAQIAAMRQQLARLSAALEASEAKSLAQNAQIVDLGRRLNLALASKFEELARYRSEFFGRLREVLGDRKDIRVVGDRFVFQSEVLFDSGSADLQAGGQAQIASLAKTLLEISSKIPRELNWVMRVDGHTDRRPIKTPQFPSNWELSTGRAISVVRHLVNHGVPPDRLVAAGFGQWQPLDTRADEIAFRRNRRIEFKLTER